MVATERTEPLENSNSASKSRLPEPISDELERELEAQIGGRLRRAREDMKLSQREFGEAMGYSAPMISAFEGGTRRMKLGDLAKACIVLAKSPEFFLEAEMVPDPEPVGLALRADLATLPAGDLMNAVGSLLDQVEATLPIASDVPDLGHLQPEAAARDVLERLALIEPPVEIDVVCERLRIPLYRHPFPDELSAVVFTVPDQSFVIGANSTHSDTRRRFSIAHEIGHAVMRHECNYYLEYSVEDAWEPPNYDYLEERAANAFAAALLMDAQNVRADFANGIRDVATLASRYAVSQAAMGFRLKNLGLE